MAVHHQNPIQLGAPVRRLDQQWDVQYQPQRTSRYGLLGMELDGLAYQGMQDGFQLCANACICKSACAHISPIQRSIWGHCLRAKRSLNGCHGRATGGRQTARDRIGIQNGGTALGQHGCDGTFATANPTRQSQSERAGAACEAALLWHDYAPSKCSMAFISRVGLQNIAAKPAPAKKGPNGI